MEPIMKTKCQNCDEWFEEIESVYWLGYQYYLCNKCADEMKQIRKEMVR